jgi:hypothetical protein
MNGIGNTTFYEAVKVDALVKRCQGLHLLQRLNPSQYALKLSENFMRLVGAISFAKGQPGL